MLIKWFGVNIKIVKKKLGEIHRVFYYIYTSGSEYGIYSMEGFECYTYDNMPDKTFDIMEDSTYFELAPNGVPTFVGLA